MGIQVGADATVRVAVATLWRQPEAVRVVDAPALGRRPDIAGWVSAMDAGQRLGDGVLSQLLLGERVLVDGVRPDGWVRVVALEQPADRLDPRGYPGWVPAGQLQAATDPRPGTPPATRVTGAGLLAAAGELLGVPYVWGGLSGHGIDCSGLVHLTWRRFGVRLPRDAVDQAAATTVVPLGEERPGDLYVFARPDRPVHHIGFVTAAPRPDGARRMLHACYTHGRVVEEQLPAERTATLVGARRVG